MSLQSIKLAIKFSLRDSPSEAWSPQCPSAYTCTHLCTPASLKSVDHSEWLFCPSTACAFSALCNTPQTLQRSLLYRPRVMFIVCFYLQIQSASCPASLAFHSPTPLTYELSQGSAWRHGLLQFTRRYKGVAVRDPSPTPHPAVRDPLTHF